MVKRRSPGVLQDNLSSHKDDRSREKMTFVHVTYQIHTLATHCLEFAFLGGFVAFTFRVQFQARGLRWNLEIDSGNASCSSGTLGLTITQEGGVSCASLHMGNRRRGSTSLL